MGRHRMPKEHRAPWTGLRTLFARSAKRDSLFERSFRRCAGCGDDVYVLAEGCRACGRAVPAFA